MVCEEVRRRSLRELRRDSLRLWEARFVVRRRAKRDWAVRLRSLRELRRDSLRLWEARFLVRRRAKRGDLAEARRRRAKAGSSGWIRTSNPPVNSHSKRENAGQRETI